MELPASRLSGLYGISTIPGKGLGIRASKEIPFNAEVMVCAVKVMHSLPRKNELMNCVDDTGYNLYFQQMKNSRWVFQCVFWRQRHGFGESKVREYAAV